MNLDELQKELEGVLALLKDRQVGLFSWNEALYERLETVVGLLRLAGF